MIHYRDYNCKDQGECYLSYRKRMKREKEEYEAKRPIRQTNEEWIDEYVSYSAIYATGIFRRQGESTAQFLARFESKQEGSVGNVERGNEG